MKNYQSIYEILEELFLAEHGLDKIPPSPEEIKKAVADGEGYLFVSLCKMNEQNISVQEMLDWIRAKRKALKEELKRLEIEQLNRLHKL